MKPAIDTDTRTSFWQLIFKQSPVNGARYNGESLVRVPWQWPSGTYLDRALQRKREQSRPERRERDPLCTGLLIFAFSGIGFQIVRWAIV